MNTSKTADVIRPKSFEDIVGQDHLFGRNGVIRRMLDANNVVWQIGELGKVDAGGGGTVAMYVANLDIDTIDLGVPVLSMHAPLEVVSKLDVYMAYKAFKVFFEQK